MPIPRVHEALSWVPLKLKTFASGQELSIATGFIYLHGSRSFLVTNFHVVSGRNPETDILLDQRGLAPDTLIVGLASSSPENQRSGLKKVQWNWTQYQLFSDGDYSRPIWTVHPEHGGRADVVAIPFSGVAETRNKPANASDLDLDRIRVYPGMDAFVLGYPRGMSGGGHLPIWKRATIATEPDFDLDGLPRFHIDTATREGMSGSPVYAQEVGYWLPEGESDEKNACIGKGRRFVGVYSGRLGAEDEFKAQLGIVWKESAIIDVVEAVPPEAVET